MGKYVQLENEKYIWHVDDYGISPMQSAKIIECIEDGIINSVSVVSNSRFIEECSQLLKKTSKEVKVGIHLNLLEGYSVHPKEEIPLIVNERGVMKRSFFSLMLHSFLPGRNELKRQIKKELMAQIDLFVRLYGVDIINVDSHNHFHMIPIVCEALIEGIKEKGYKIGIVRIPKEPLLPYFKTFKCKCMRYPLNIVKNIVLRILSLIDRKNLKDYYDKSPLFCGIILTGRMTLEHTIRLIVSFTEVVDKKGRAVEFLFHPGGLKERDEYLDPDIPTFVEFYNSNMRELEFETCIQIKARYNGKGV